LGILRGFLLACVCVVACDRGAHGAPKPNSSAPPPLSHVAPPAPSSAVAASPAEPASFVSLVRAERWADARAAIEALPEARRNEPEVRFAHARVVLELGDAEATLHELDGLDAALPTLAAEIAALRARAPAARHARVRLFLEFAPEVGTAEVPDPYYGGANGFEEVLDLVEAAARALLAHLRRELSAA